MHLNSTTNVKTLLSTTISELALIIKAIHTEPEVLIIPKDTHLSDIEPVLCDAVKHTKTALKYVKLIEERFSII